MKVVYATRLPEIILHTEVSTKTDLLELGDSVVTIGKDLFLKNIQVFRDFTEPISVASSPYQIGNKTERIECSWEMF